MLVLTDGEFIAVSQAIFVAMAATGERITASQEYCDRLAGRTDELGVGYFKSSQRYTDGLRTELENLKSVYVKLRDGLSRVSEGD